jgi:serine/threonine protein kinase
MVKPTLDSGTIIDGFAIGGLVHTGGMALLWDVTHPDIDTKLLMKVPRLQEGEDPAAIVSFEMEQLILPRLAGPHAPRCFGIGSFEVQPYIVMERIAGTSLLPRLPELPLAPGEVAALGARIATALDSLHRQHVVHLDLKPSNVMLRPGGDVALIDFGLSTHAQLPDLMEEEFRLPYGTAPYMAPEQVLGRRRDPRSDLFALGALMYFFVTGERPFGDPQRLSGLKRRLWRDPVPPRRLRPDCPPWLQEIILRCLEVNPAWRHPTAAQLAFDLGAPTTVKLTARSEKLKQDSFGTVLRRRFNEDYALPAPEATVPSRIAAAPIVVVAVDLRDGNEAIAEALRRTVARVLDTSPDARLACVNVLKLHRLAPDPTLDRDGHNRHVRRLVELRQWAAPLKLADGKATFHVLEEIDPATAILDYVRANNVDHVVMGARADSMLRTLLGSVSAQVAAHAPCTVTVVRARGPAATPD